MSLNNAAGQFGDTSYTKVFVGGLAWQTRRETMNKYFEQFGEILEAVVIADKNTGRSKGYGFVTFKEPEAAKRACVDPAPVIDGRRANCNIASLGVQRSRPSTPQHCGRRNFKVMNPFSKGFQGGVGAAFPVAPTFPQYGIQQGIPYCVYGYSPCSPNYTYPTSYYNVSGGTTGDYLVYGTGTRPSEMITSPNPIVYPYLQHGQGFEFQYPQHNFHYSTIASSCLPQPYNAPTTFISSYKQV